MKPVRSAFDDHRRGLVEALARLVHGAAEGGELAPRQPAAQTEAQPALAQQVEHRGLLRDAQRIVPRHDDRRGAEIDVRAERRRDSVISCRLSGQNE